LRRFIRERSPLADLRTTERGGGRRFADRKRVGGRKYYILMDTLGIPIACRVEPANSLLQLNEF